MPRLATIVVALLAAAGVLFPAFPTATAAEIVAAPTGVTIRRGTGLAGRRPVPARRQGRDPRDPRNNIAMKALRAKQLPFPDGAILAKLAWKRAKSAEFDNTFVPGEPQRIEFMVKNAKKYAATGGGGSVDSSTASLRASRITPPASRATRPTSRGTISSSRGTRRKVRGAFRPWDSTSRRCAAEVPGT